MRVVLGVIGMGVAGIASIQGIVSGERPKICDWVRLVFDDATVSGFLTQPFVFNTGAYIMVVLANASKRNRDT